MNSVNVWRFTQYYDFTPAVPNIREDNLGSILVPATAANAGFVMEPFSDGFVDRSITGRTRSKIQGYRLRGELILPYVPAAVHTQLLQRVLYRQLIVNDRIFETLVSGVDYGSVTSFQLDPIGSNPLPSSIGSFYVGMIINFGVGRVRRITAYNGASKTFTVDSAVTVNEFDTGQIIVPAGVPSGFYLNNVDSATGQIDCIINNESPIGVLVENQIARQPYTIEFQSRNLLSTIPDNWLKQ